MDVDTGLDLDLDPISLVKKKLSIFANKNILVLENMAIKKIRKTKDLVIFNVDHGTVTSTTMSSQQYRGHKFREMLEKVAKNHPELIGKILLYLPEIVPNGQEPYPVFTTQCKSGFAITCPILNKHEVINGENILKNLKIDNRIPWDTKKDKAVYSFSVPFRSRLQILHEKNDIIDCVLTHKNGKSVHPFAEQECGKNSPLYDAYLKQVKKDFYSRENQLTYKYIVNCRGWESLSWKMLSDSLVINYIPPNESVDIWANQYLLHNYNCINLTNLDDLSSDLFDSLKANPDKCQQMIKNANRVFCKILTEEYMYLYYEQLFIQYLNMRLECIKSLS